MTEKAFLKHRTSWQWFDKAIDSIQKQKGQITTLELNQRLLLEIVKELQFLNDKEGK